MSGDKNRLSIDINLKERLFKKLSDKKKAILGFFF